ncbi:MAG: efflux RND transporter periplasmic adaptor subunit, partial [Actinomycetota bacterium]|nr:efflux RND transporter periplasmic adaptor subunit [Actinomycetota bacterium]
MPIRHPLAAGPVPADRPPAARPVAGPVPARARRRRRWLAAGAVAAAAAALAGCGRMGAALSQQWIDVQLAPTT